MQLGEHSQISKCGVSGEPICRRMFNFNLALGNSEEYYSLQVLAQTYNKSPEDMFDFGFDYVSARECFRKEWRKMVDRSECPLPQSCQIDKCFSKTL